jgi:hypothetical protein
MHFAAHVWKSRVVRPSWSRFFVGAAASKMQANNSSRVSTCLFWTSASIQLHKQKSNGVRRGDSNRSVSLTVQNRRTFMWTFFLTMTFPPESLCPVAVHTQFLVSFINVDYFRSLQHIPGGIIRIFHWHNPFGHTMTLESTQLILLVALWSWSRLS